VERVRDVIAEQAGIMVEIDGSAGNQKTGKNRNDRAIGDLPGIFSEPYEGCCLRFTFAK
jgi:hypothetical protein